MTRRTLRAISIVLALRAPLPLLELVEILVFILTLLLPFHESFGFVS